MLFLQTPGQLVHLRDQQRDSKTFVLMGIDQTRRIQAGVTELVPVPQQEAGQSRSLGSQPSASDLWR